jgi:hypothetical protein
MVLGRSCSDRSYYHGCRSGVIARNVNAELDVPWFLEAFGPDRRAALIDTLAVTNGLSRRVGAVEVVLHILCSIQAAALDVEDGTPLRAVLDYGHGLFSSREEASVSWLHPVADEQGYVTVACDWRGMSAQLACFG